MLYGILQSYGLKTVHRVSNSFEIFLNICDPLWQKQAEVANDKTAEISLNTIQL